MGNMRSSDFQPIYSVKSIGLKVVLPRQYRSARLFMRMISGKDQRESYYCCTWQQVDGKHTITQYMAGRAGFYDPLLKILHLTFLLNRGPW